MLVQWDLDVAVARLSIGKIRTDKGRCVQSLFPESSGHILFPPSLVNSCLFVVEAHNSFSFTVRL